MNCKPIRITLLKYENETINGEEWKTTIEKKEKDNIIWKEMVIEKGEENEKEYIYANIETNSNDYISISDGYESIYVKIDDLKYIIKKTEEFLEKQK